MLAKRLHSGTSINIAKNKQNYYCAQPVVNFNSVTTSLTELMLLAHSNSNSASLLEVVSRWWSLSRFTTHAFMIVNKARPAYVTFSSVIANSISTTANTSR